MGLHVSKELEQKILEMARPRQDAPAAPPPVFADEHAFMAAVIAQARKFDWYVYHVYDSRRSEPGWPDLVMLRLNRLIAAECKRSKKEKPTTAQRMVLRRFQEIPGATVAVWSPEMWDEIVRELS